MQSPIGQPIRHSNAVSAASLTPATIFGLLLAVAALSVAGTLGAVRLASGRAPVARELAATVRPVASHAATTPISFEKHDGIVTKVLHGDTLQLDGALRVRLIGVDTLSPADPRPEFATCGEETRAFVAALVENTRVRLEYEGDRIDDYGRTRAHVRLSDGRLLSAAIVEAGYGVARGNAWSTADSALARIERRARAQKAGLWRDAEAPAASDAIHSAVVDSPGTSAMVASIELRPSRSYDPSPVGLRPLDQLPAASPEPPLSAHWTYEPPSEPTFQPATTNRPPPRPATNPSVAENGSYYGEISPATGRPRTVHVFGYIRSDGTYVRGHYRSRPRY